MIATDDHRHVRFSTMRRALLALTLLGPLTVACSADTSAPRGLGASSAAAAGDGSPRIVLLSATASGQPTVTTPAGTFPAATYAGSLSFGVDAYRGIRYAAAPVGDLRWAPPVPPQATQGVSDATAFGSSCPQVASPFGLASTDEDCLFLNVYVPDGTAPRANLPVMVFYYGGAFISGTSNLYDPTQLVVEGKVIVVTVNYRLGVLGYMASPELSSTASSGVSGNYGLLDQQLALQWVRQNIGAFGGNARNVTIFGESAGGFSVCALLTAPSAAGLFNRAISESGPCAFPLPALSASEANGTAFTHKVNCDEADAADTVACLRKLTVQQVLDSQPSSSELLSSPTGLTAFFPNVDGKTIPQQPATALALGQWNRVPAIVGTNLSEGNLFIALAYDILGKAPLTADQYPMKIGQTAQALASQLGSDPNSLTQQILNEYPLTNYTSPDQALATVLGDGTFSCPALITDELLSLNSPTFAYEFADQAAPMTLLPPVSFPYGATHTDELQFLFTHLTEAPVLTADENQLGATMRGYWTQFAQTGNPNALLSGQPYWPNFSIVAPNMMGLVAPTPAVRTNFSDEHHCTFWQNVLVQGAVQGALGGS